MADLVFQKRQSKIMYELVTFTRNARVLVPFAYQFLGRDTSLSLIAKNTTPCLCRAKGRNINNMKKKGKKN